MNINLKKGFTAVEMLLVISCLMVLVLAAIPNSVKVKTSADNTLMRERGLALNTAIAAFVRDQGGTTAQAAWDAAASDQDKYVLLKSYLAYPPDNLSGSSSAYLLTGYTVTLPSTIRTLQTGVMVYNGTTLILNSDGQAP